MRLNKAISVIILVCLSIYVVAQNNTTIELSYGLGSIIKHKSTIGHLVRAHPQFYNLKMVKNKDTLSQWQKRFNYPEQGFGVLYQSFFNDQLGSVWALNYNTIFYLRNRHKRNLFRVSLGLGFAYATKPYHVKTNNQNNVISTPVTYSVHTALSYQRTISAHLSTEIGLHFTHFSNASFKQPNNGINTAFLGVSLQYHDAKRPVYPKPEKPEKPLIMPWHFGMALKLGLHESSAGLGTKPVYELSPYVSKQLMPLGHLTAGVDAIISKADKTYADYLLISNIEDPNRQLKNHKRLGLNVGYEQYFKHISCEINVGYYLYEPLDIYTAIYQNVRIKYHLDQSHWRIGLGLKLHKLKANYSALEIQYQL